MTTAGATWKMLLISVSCSARLKSITSSIWPRHSEWLPWSPSYPAQSTLRHTPTASKR